MSGSSRRQRTVLALDPAARGFGFVVLEGHDFLVDWSLRGTRAHGSRELLAVVENLIEEYRPDVVVVEDPATSRRGKRARDFIEATHRLATKEGLTCRCLSRRATQRALALSGATTAHAVAVRLVERFPELVLVLPPRRKVYMSEDARMHIFRALALAVASEGRTLREQLGDKLEP